jgi:hypothetical protein
MVPLAEIKTAGVIIAVNTASDEVNGSIRSNGKILATRAELYQIWSAAA